jgi:chromosome segregation protein
MMEQGRIDLILSSRPEDRRAVFEEAAGITKYKTQKREALRKLEATEANLLRLSDIIKEVKRQIGSLQRQAGKARRYQALLADLQILDTHHSRAQLETLEKDLENSRHAIKRLENEQRTTESEIEDQENEISSHRAQLNEVDTRINEARAEVQRLQNQISSHRSRIDFNLERARELSDLVERYQGDVRTAEGKLAQQQSEIHDNDLLVAETERLLAAKRTELEELNERATEVRKTREERERELHDLELSLSKADNRLADFEEEAFGIVARRAATEPRLAQLQQSLGEVAHARDGIGAQLEAMRTRTAEEHALWQDLMARLPAKEAELHRLQQQLREAEGALIKNDRDLAERQSRLEILRQLNAEGEGLAQGSQAVLRGLDQPERILPAVRGALISLIEVEDEYIAAIEAALGRNLHAIILENQSLALEIISAVKEKKLGQAALIGAESIESAIPAHQLPPGTLGWAADRVHAPATLASLVRRLLGGIVLVRDLEQALSLRPEFPALSFVTRDGEVISAEGVIFGGRVREESSSILARKAQIAAVAAEHRELLEQEGLLREERNQIEHQVQVAADHLEQLREEHQAARAKHAETSSQTAAFEREWQEVSRKFDALDWERSTLDQQLRASAERVQQLEEEAAEQRKLLTEGRARQTELQGLLESERLRDDELAEQLRELQLSVATERQRHEGLRTQRQPMTARQAELEELIATRRSDIANYEARLKQQAAENAAAEKAIEEGQANLAAAEAAVEKIAAARATRLAEIETLESNLRARRKELSELHDARGKEEVRQTQAQLKIENLVEHVSRRYQIDLREFAPDRYSFTKTYRAQIKQRGIVDAVAESEDSAESEERALREIIEQLTRQLDAMGPVNLEAVQEYDELEERYKFLESQNTDLTNSRRELLDVIARINETSEKLFAETFAQVRINFREMFAELFGGGRADLNLVDENDALNCGIEIIAKPPGKQLQGVSLLSGGERTMTAVALLFAIYMVRPSPFCILDEMDAPLDESNINRFTRVLDRFVNQSQFIIITHNKRTIAKADILYGVTMEERGISKLVGMRLTKPSSEKESAPAEEPTARRQASLDFEEAAPETVALSR